MLNFWSGTPLGFSEERTAKRVFMSTLALTLDEWHIRFHEAMAAVLRATEAVKRQFGFWGLMNGLWKCNRDLKDLIQSLKAVSEMPDGILADEMIASHIPQFQELVSSIEELIDTGRREGLTNRSLTAGVLEAIRSRGESVADYLDSLKMSLDPEVMNAIAQGRDQIAHGDFESLDSLL